MERKCSTCAHYFVAVENNEGMGECRESSPQLTYLLVPGQSIAQARPGLQLQNFAGWPPVGGERHWCGKWRSSLSKGISLMS